MGFPPSELRDDKAQIFPPPPLSNTKRKHAHGRWCIVVARCERRDRGRRRRSLLSGLRLLLPPPPLSRSPFPCCRLGCLGIKGNQPADAATLFTKNARSKSSSSSSSAPYYYPARSVLFSLPCDRCTQYLHCSRLYIRLGPGLNKQISLSPSNRCSNTATANVKMVTFRESKP